MSHASNNITHHPDHNMLTSMLKVFSIFKAIFEYDQYDTNTELVGFWIKCYHVKRDLHYHMTHKYIKDTISIFSKWIPYILFTKTLYSKLTAHGYVLQ